MDLERLARVVEQAQEDKGISDYALEHEIGRPGGRAFNAKQIGLWKAGKRVQPLPRAVVLRMIEILDLPAFETAELAGVFPPGVTADMLRRLDMVAVLGPRELASVQGEKHTGWYPIPAGQTGSAPVIPLSDDPGEFDELVRRNRRPPLLSVPELAAA